MIEIFLTLACVGESLYPRSDPSPLSFDNKKSGESPKWSYFMFVARGSFKEEMHCPTWENEGHDWSHHLGPTGRPVFEGKSDSHANPCRTNTPFGLPAPHVGGGTSVLLETESERSEMEVKT